jgi:hypothetical protein
MKNLFLNKAKPLSISTIISLLAFVVFSCDIKEPTAPSWDIELNLPLFDTTYTLRNIIERDSTVLKPDYTQQGLIVYSTSQNVDSIQTKDKLIIDNFSTSSSNTLGSIKIDNDSSKSDVGFDWLQQFLPPGQTSTVLPEFNRPVNSQLEQLENFESIKIESGTVQIKIQNHFPEIVNFVIDGLTIRNVVNNEIILQTNTQLNIQPNSIAEFPPLSLNPNVIIKNQLKFETIVSTNGSNGNVVQIPLKTFTVYVNILNLVVAEARAKIPVQNPVIIDSTLIIDENEPKPTKFKSVKFESGLLNITLKNNLDIDANVALEIPNLKTQSNSSFVINKLITRKSTTHFVENLNLANYSLVSLNGNPTNKISYKFTFNTVPSNDYRTLKKTDSFEANVDFTSLSIKEFDGIIKPTQLDETRSSINLDSEDLQKTFSFSQIYINRPIIELRLKSSPGTKLNFKITGRLEGKNSIGERSILNFNPNTLSTTTITDRDSILRFNPDSLTNFFKRFSRLPDSIIFYAGGILNDRYEQIIVSNTTTLKGRSLVELPFDVGIGDANYKDSLKLDFDEDTRKNIRDLKSGELNFSIINGLPVSISFSGKLYDKNNRFLMYFPPQKINQDTVITINGANTDANGYAISKSTNNIKFKLSDGDSELLSKADYIRILVKLNTFRSNNLPVKFRVSDDFKIRSYGNINYKIKP